MSVNVCVYDDVFSGGAGCIISRRVNVQMKRDVKYHCRWQFEQLTMQHCATNSAVACPDMQIFQPCLLQHNVWLRDRNHLWWLDQNRLRVSNQLPKLLGWRTGLWPTVSVLDRQTTTRKRLAYYHDRVHQVTIACATAAGGIESLEMFRINKRPLILDI